jgi:hypothetical protein
MDKPMVKESENTLLFKMVVKTGSQDGKEFQYCMDNKIIGVGWCFEDEDKKLYTPTDIDDAIRIGRECYPHNRGFITALNRLKEIEPNDLIWTRNEGIYYICRALGKWKYANDEGHIEKDVCNFVDVEFVEVGTLEKVPGKIVNCFRARSSIQRIHDDNHVMTNITRDMYNKLTGKNVYETIPYVQNDILDLLQPEDVEEIVSLYLQVEKNYLVYTSTNKLDTQKYEFVAVARDGSHYCYPQVKTGQVTLNGNDYKELVKNGNKVYLFATSNVYYNVDERNIISISKNELLDFLSRNKKIMPYRIQQWM